MEYWRFSRIMAVIPFPLFLGCGGNPMGPGAAAVLSATLATGVSVLRRANHECITWCDKGTVCNPSTGLCERVACPGDCRDDEVCVVDGLLPRCVPQAEAGKLGIRENGESPRGAIPVRQTGVQDTSDPRLEPPPPQ